MGWLELFGGLIGEVLRDLGSVLGVVCLVGPGGGRGAAEAAPVEDDFGEDADRGAAGVFDGKLRVRRVLPLITRLVTVDAEGTVRSR
jgi:hypothetical protein